MTDHPHVCPICAESFEWGPERTVAENAHWKLSTHMNEKHADVLFACPRRSEGVPAFMKNDLDYWRDDDTCSYCGSLSPEKFFAAVVDGVEVGPTDKPYQAYLDPPNPNVGRVSKGGSTSGPVFKSGGVTLDDRAPKDLTDEEYRSGRYSRDIFSPEGPSLHHKFYFQHLSEVEMHRFIALHNDGTMKIGMPGHFYSRPFFFAVRAKESAA